MHRVVILFAISLLSGNLIGQEIITVHHACNYHGADKKGRIYSYDSDKDAKLALEEIMEFTGLPPNFELKATNVPNAAAALQGNKRYIFYNQRFMQRISRSTQSDWTAFSILAHEIGHHLSGHTLADDTDRHVVELQADRFSGYILYQMGATQEQALLALNELADEESTPTHPSKYDRELAVLAGWNQAKEKFSAKPNYDANAAVGKNHSVVAKNSQESSSKDKKEHNALSHSSRSVLQHIDHKISELGVTGMRMNIGINTADLIPGEYKCVVWFYDKNGSRLEDKNGIYKSSSKQVSAGVDLEISRKDLGGTYETTLFMPYPELHQGEGYNEASFKIGLFRKNPLSGYERVQIEKTFNDFSYFSLDREMMYEVEYSRIEPNKNRKGTDGIELIVKAKVENMDKEDYMMVAWFYDENGEPLKDFNNKYSSNGVVVSYESFSYDDGPDEIDLRLFLPYDEFHLPKGQYDLQYRIGVYKMCDGELELVRREKIMNSFYLYH